MIKVRQDQNGAISQVEAQCATVLWDSFGPHQWQLTISVCGDQEHKIVLRLNGDSFPFILEGKNFNVEYTAVTEPALYPKFQANGEPWNYAPGAVNLVNL